MRVNEIAEVGRYGSTKEQVALCSEECAEKYLEQFDEEDEIELEWTGRATLHSCAVCKSYDLCVSTVQ